MFQYDNDYTESNWRHEADARELAELDRDRRDMRETPMPPIQMRLNLTEEKWQDLISTLIIHAQKMAEIESRSSGARRWKQ